MQPITNYFSNITKSRLIVRPLIMLVLLFGVIIAAFFAWDYFFNQKVVTLNPTNGTTITIGVRANGGSTMGEQIASTNTLKKVRLYPGIYAIKFSGSSDYQYEQTSITIDSSTEIETPDLNYTNKKLIQLLSDQKTKINSVVFGVLPNSNYKINTENLYNTGQWYGAVLIPNDWYDPNIPSNIIPRPTNINNTQDMLRLIMKKENNQWKVVAGPSVIIYIKNYAGIPQDIIRAVNKLGFS